MEYYMGNDEYWNDKFNGRSNIPLHPEKILIEDAKKIEFGKTGLELACGDGRNTLYFASNGWEMTGIDFSQAGLERLSRFASENNQTVKTICVDLSDIKFLEYLDTYDFIFINHYRLQLEIYPLLVKYLNPNGYLWVNGFSKKPSDIRDITDRDIISKVDFALIGLNLIACDDYSMNNQEFIRMIFQK